MKLNCNILLQEGQLLNIEEIKAALTSEQMLQIQVYTAPCRVGTVDHLQDMLS